MPVVDERTVHRVRPDQIDALRAFQIQAYGPDSTQADVAHFDWMYRRDGESAPSVVVFEVRGRIVGQVGLLPCALQIGGRTLRGHWLPDLIVLPEVRRLGVGIHLVEAAEKLGDVAMASSVSAELAPGLRRRGWVEIGNVPSYVLPLDPAPFVTAELKRRGLSPPRAASLLLGLAGRAAASIASVMLSASRGPYEIATVEPAAIELLWKRAAGDDWIGTPRTAAFVSWRFGGRPGGYALLGAFDGARCAAYAAIRVKGLRGHAKLGDARVGTIVDLLGDSDQALDAILLAAAARCAREGCHVVLTGGLVPGRPRLARLPWLAVSPKWMPMLWARDPTTRALLARRERWLFTRADGDGDAGL